MSTASTPPTSRGVSPLGLVVAVVASVAITAVAVVAAVYVTGRPATAASAGGRDGSAPADAEPYSQSGRIEPHGESSGVVYYPVPYAGPPNLTVLPGARYLIVKQDELGFTWLDRARMKDARSLVASVPELAALLPKSEEAKFDPEQPPLSWEARGVRAAAGVQPMIPFEQTGTFVSDLGQQGQVNFVFPYASPPNVELTAGSREKTVIVECTATGFKWKNGSTGKWPSEYGEVTWKARGIRATRLPASKDG
jgi:hypothetical protein